MLHNVMLLNDASRSIFCGPFAMAATTGKKMTEVYKALGELDFDNSEYPTHTDASQLLHGMYNLGFSESLRLGFKFFEEFSMRHRRPATIVDMPTLENGSEIYIVGVPGHWVAYKDGMACCNIHREVVPLATYAERMGPNILERVTGFNSL